MSPACEATVTVEAFLQAEASSTVKHEYVAGRVYPQAGATRRHNLVAATLLARFWTAARGTDCAVFGSNMLLRAAADLYYYPDLQVVCGQDDGTDRYTTSPCIVVEVLSPSTSDVDRREKVRAYRALPSLQSYLIVYQDERRVEHHAREADGEWYVQLVAGEGTLSVPCVQLELTLDEIYEDVS